MTAFPDPAATVGVVPGSSVGGITPQTEFVELAHSAYDRRPLMPMPLPGFVGVPFFRGRDATEFLERYDELCEEYNLTTDQKVAKLPRYCERSISDVIKTLKE